MKTFYFVSFQLQVGGSDVGPYTPVSIDTSNIALTNELNTLVQKFSEHYHDAWAQRKQEAGWAYSGAV